MRIQINVDWNLPNWARKITYVLVPSALVLGASAIASAGPEVPHTFAAGQTLSAQSLNENFNALREGIDHAVPPGTIMAYAGNEVPSGWLPCDGSELEADDELYVPLYAAIGTAYGGNKTSQKFNLPDLRGRFLRGWDQGAGNDPDAASRTAMAEGGETGDAVGTLQGDELKAHSHFKVTGTYYAESGFSFGAVDDYEYVDVGGAETRPKNVAVQYIIKL